MSMPTPASTERPRTSAAMYQTKAIREGSAVDEAPAHLNRAGRAEQPWSWVIQDAQGRPAGIASHPRLAQLQVRLLDDALLLLAPGQQPLYLALPAAGRAKRVSMLDPGSRRAQTLAGQDAGAVAAEFLRELTGAELRMLLLEPAL